MNKNVIIAALILIIIAGVLLFALAVSKAVSYIAIGIVVAAFVALLLVTRK